MNRSLFYRSLAIFSPFILISMILWLGPAEAGAQTALKTAIIDSQKAFDRSAEGRKAVALLQEKEDEIKAAIKEREQEINSLRNKLDSQRLTLNQEALSQLQLEIDIKEAEKNKYEQDSSAEFNQFKTRLIKKIRDDLLAIVEGLVKERDYELVFDLSSSGLIYFQPALDITEEVIKRYDEAASRR
ncbi:MAG: OmpH family outer membrane protein [Acidobacteriota bacterium]|nr:OmpH family outer membrane protein [Acidobacteriota bacterium]